ncbi:MAG: hypothetical protein Q8N83_10690 [Ignavibacteria bacterium]|nr:hypothetical protein [Ignavibacteria bacterium]
MVTKLKIHIALFFMLPICMIKAQYLQTAKTNSYYDVETEKCMICHDGSIGRSIDVSRNLSLSNVDQFSNATDHPIGMKYDSIYFQKPDEYVNPRLLTKSIQLVEGRVSCISCHHIVSTLNTTIRFTQTVYNQCPVDTKANNMDRKYLCLACHLK